MKRLEQVLLVLVLGAVKWYVLGKLGLIGARRRIGGAR